MQEYCSDITFEVILHPTHTQASHSHLSHTMTVFIQAAGLVVADQRPPFTSPLG